MNDERAPGMPHWARRVDDYGRKRWHKEKPVKNRRGEYITAIIWSLVWLFIVNKIPDWHLRFINEHYLTVLYALNMNIIIQIGANAVMLILDFRFVRYLSKILMETANFLCLIIIYYIYPFDFTGISGLSWLDTVIPILLVIGMVVSALKVISNTWKLIFWKS